MEYVLKEHVQPNGPRLGLLEWLTTKPARLPDASIEVLPFFNLTMVWNRGWRCCWHSPFPELLQNFSYHRSVSLFDILSNLLGIGLSSGDVYRTNENGEELKNKKLKLMLKTDVKKLWKLDRGQPRIEQHSITGDSTIQSFNNWIASERQVRRLKGKVKRLKSKVERLKGKVERLKAR